MKLTLAASLLLATEVQAGSVRRTAGHECMTITEIACGTEGFSTLCGALEATGLDDVLSGMDDFTVFAPTDDAFGEISSIVAGLDTATLTEVVLYHAAAGKVMAADLECSETFHMANGLDTRTKCRGGDFFQSGIGNSKTDEPKIIGTDIMACNGVVHVIDEVLLPMEVGDIPIEAPTCDAMGFSQYPYKGMDNSQRMLLREGVIDEIPGLLCPKDRVDEETGVAPGKNVILVVGDGMGWEMVRAGAVAKNVLKELGELGCDAVSGECPEDLKMAAKEAFMGRSLSDYYTEGAGSGLSFQDSLEFDLMTTTTTVIQAPNPGNHYAPANSLLAGNVGDHKSGQAPLALNECGFPIDFSPKDFMADGGNMVLWDDMKGGEFPWDERYFQENPDMSDGFDPTYIMQHATDSASTAGCMATGHKAAVNMMSQTLYEEDVSTLVEDAMMCGKAGGVVTSVPMFHATPGAFIIHTNSRSDRDSLRRSFEKVNPTYAGGVCGGRYYPYPETLESMRSGALSSQWTLLEQKNTTMKEDFYAGEEFTSLDPDNGDHLLVCMGGDFSASGQSNMPYRGVDSSYANRWCSDGEAELDPDTGDVIGVMPTTPDELCNHYSPEEVAQIPVMKDNVKAALDFLGKDDDGFFLMYEQGDIDWAAHANHMDDMLGTMFDIDEGVQTIMDWIEANGGYEKNAIYVTADHDHFLTLLPHFPETLAMMLIEGEGHNITPQNNTNSNPWSAAIRAGRHEDDSKSQVEHINDFSSWTDEDIASAGHFWGPFGAGGNGWGSHSTRPVPLFHAGDDGCLNSLMGAGFQVLGRDVTGSPGKVDQMHLHACMQKHLLGF